METIIALYLTVVYLPVLGVFSLRDMYEQFQNIMKMGPFGQIMVKCYLLTVMLLRVSSLYNIIETRQIHLVVCSLSSWAFPFFLFNM